MAGKKKPRKPTGITGPTKLSAGPEGATTEFQQLRFPSDKEAVEELVAQGFVRAMSSRSDLGFSIQGYAQNPQDDFDFQLQTPDGLRYARLLRGFDPESLRHNKVHNLDPRAWKSDAD